MSEILKGNRTLQDRVNDIYGLESKVIIENFNQIDRFLLVRQPAIFLLKTEKHSRKKFPNLTRAKFGQDSQSQPEFSDKETLSGHFCVSFRALFPVYHSRGSIYHVFVTIFGLGDCVQAQHTPKTLSRREVRILFKLLKKVNTRRCKFHFSLHPVSKVIIYL